MLPIILIFVVTLGISLLASWRVRANYAKYSRVPNANGLTGAQAADAVLRQAGIHDVEIVATRGTLTDHYDPRHKRLALSEGNYGGRSIAAVGVAAHEAGHAIQHAKAYGPLHLRMAAVGITNIASSIVMWLPIIGIVTGLFATSIGLWIMAAGWGVIMFFNLVTLPVEFDATRRAKAVLTNSGMIAPAERRGVDKVLNAAALTYVAAFITSLVYMLFYLLPLLTGRND